MRAPWTTLPYRLAPWQAARTEPEQAAEPPQARLKVLGQFVADQLPIAADDPIHKRKGPLTGFLVIALSAPHHYLVPTEDEYGRIAARWDQTKNKFEILPREKMSVEDPDLFTLILDDGRRQPGLMYSRWPVGTGPGELFTTRSMHISHFAGVPASERRLFAIAWPIDAVKGSATYRVQARDYEPVRVPDDRLEPPPVSAAPTKPRSAKKSPLEQERLARFTRLRQAMEQAQRGQTVEAVAGAEAVVKDERADANDFYNAACVLSVASASVRRSQDIPQPQRDDRAEKLAVRAIALLSESVRQGYDNLAHLSQDTDFDAVRSHKEFKELLEQLKKK